MDNWFWGLTLIVLTVIMHAVSAASIALTQRNVWSWLEDQGDELQHAFRNWIIMCAMVALFLAILHGLEIGIWAFAYYRLGGLDSFSDTLFYSMDSMTTRGASGLVLQPQWRMMGALEGVDGMLLFGISTAFIFAMMQAYWEKLMALHPRK